MRIRKIRVFKMVYSDKTAFFDARDEDDGGIHIAFESIKSVAEHVKREADDFLSESEKDLSTVMVAIDFCPFHEIERKDAPIKPYRCLALTDDEKEQFWEYFSAE